MAYEVLGSFQVSLLDSFHGQKLKTPTIHTKQSL